jgi:hypothetical protein
MSVQESGSGTRLQGAMLSVVFTDKMLPSRITYRSGTYWEAMKLQNALEQSTLLHFSLLDVLTVLEHPPSSNLEARMRLTL